jgi:hypothetical protein
MRTTTVLQGMDEFGTQPVEARGWDAEPTIVLCEEVHGFKVLAVPLTGVGFGAQTIKTTLPGFVSFLGTGSAPTNRITSATRGATLSYSYDANGNVTNDGLHSYTNDSENRVMKVDAGAAVYATIIRIGATANCRQQRYSFMCGKVIKWRENTTGVMARSSFPTHMQDRACSANRAAAIPRFF